MKSIPVGAAGSFSLVVQLEHLASRFKDGTLPPVLATPIMIMKKAALNAIKPEAGSEAMRWQRTQSGRRAKVTSFTRRAGRVQGEPHAANATTRA